MSTHPHPFRALAARALFKFVLWSYGLALAGLLTACPLTGDGGVSWSISALPTEPAEIRLAPGESAEVRVSYGIETEGDTGSDFLCGAVEGVPGGLAVNPAACPLASVVLGSGTVMQRSFRIQALTVASGTYDLRFSAKLCVKADPDDLTTGGDATCRAAAAQLRVIVTDAPALPRSWQALGGVLNLDSVSHTDGVQLLVDAEGRPLAAWVENERVVVRRFEGGSWQTLGTPDAVGAQGRPALAVDREGAPVVAWTEARPGSTSGATQVQSRRWDGASWRRLADSPMSPGDVINAFDPVLLAHEDRVYVAWIEQTAVEGGDHIVLQYVCCTRWDNAMSTRALRVPGRASKLALSRAGFSDPVLAWKDDSDGRVKVVHVKSGEPTPIGDFPALNSNSFALTSTPAHGLLLAIAPGPPAAQFQVQRYAGGAWTPFGALQGLPGPLAGVLNLALGVEAASGAPLLAWNQHAALNRYFEVRRWGDSGWLGLDTSIFGLPPQGRTGPGVPGAVAIAGGARPLLATEVSTTGPTDRAIRVQEFR